MDKYLIAHDLGTSGDKASLFSIEGKLVKSYTASYKTHYFHNNHAEQETEDRRLVGSNLQVNKGNC